MAGFGKQAGSGVEISAAGQINPVGFFKLWD